MTSIFEPPSTSPSRLCEPIKVGTMQLRHRVALAPMTRCRTIQGRVPKQPMVKEYYKQRACVPGTLIISEGILVSKATGGGYPSPGIWSRDQISAWKEVTEAVHRQGCFIVAQLFGFGRTATVETTLEEGIDLVGPSPISIEPGLFPTPRAMTVAEIEQVVDDFATASRNAIEAGFDGVECHGANGYLLDQFISEASNQRSDMYGGSIENRARLVTDVLEAVVGAVGADRVGLRLSPFSSFQGTLVPNPVPQHEYVIRKAKELGLMYLSMVEARMSGTFETESVVGSLDFAHRLWEGRPLLVAGGYTADKARYLVDVERPRSDVVVMFGRHFVSNPDLVYRIQNRIPLTKYDRATFYTASEEGYIDYEESKEFTASYQQLE